jgi:glutaredoxin 3
MAKIIVYSKANCPYCDWAKQLLDSKKLAYEEIRIDLDTEQRVEMERLSGRRTVPQIFINGEAIGGYDALTALAKSGELDRLTKI